MNEGKVNPQAIARRQAFEDWYTLNAFDLPANPIGSRECHLQWQAWQAASRAAPSPSLGEPMVELEVRNGIVSLKHTLAPTEQFYDGMKLYASPVPAYSQADYDRNAIKVPADVRVTAPSIGVPASGEGWVKCSERMPPVLSSVLCWYYNGYVVIGMRDVDDVWQISTGGVHNSTKAVTHWMPLPVAPRVTE